MPKKKHERSCYRCHLKCLIFRNINTEIDVKHITHSFSSSTSFSFQAPRFRLKFQFCTASRFLFFSSSIRKNLYKMSCESTWDIKCGSSIDHHTMMHFVLMHCINNECSIMCVARKCALHMLYCFVLILTRKVNENMVMLGK